jgi:RNA polymerase sigma factor (sigma-70 family)
MKHSLAIRRNPANPDPHLWNLSTDSSGTQLAHVRETWGNHSLLTKQQAASQSASGGTTNLNLRARRAKNQPAGKTTARRLKRQRRNRTELTNPDGLVEKLARQYYSRVLDNYGNPLPYAPEEEDFQQQAWLGFYEAKARHNPARGSLSTVATWQIKNRLRSLLEDYFKHALLGRREELNAPAFLDDNEGDGYYTKDGDPDARFYDGPERNEVIADGRAFSRGDILSAREELEQLYQAIEDAGLNDRERAVLELRFPLDGSQPLNPIRTGRRLGIHWESVTLLEKQALDKIRAALTESTGFTGSTM